MKNSRIFLPLISHIVPLLYQTQQIISSLLLYQYRLSQNIFKAFFFFKFFDEWLCVYDHFGICLFGWLLCPAAIF